MDYPILHGMREGEVLETADEVAEVQVSIVDTPPSSDNEDGYQTATLVPPALDLQRPDTAPRRVLRSHGRVAYSSTSNIRLTNESSGVSEVILDYGRAEGGIAIFPILKATSNDEEIHIQAIYSETVREIDSETGDGPFFLFSNAMDSYRTNTHSIKASNGPQTIRVRHAHRSQRYQKLRLLTPNASIQFGAIGFNRIRPETPPKASFSCSDHLLNRIWEQDVRTVDMCTVHKGETEPAWDGLDEGTRVYGQHWAPCRKGTRWQDEEINFEVKIEKGGASWGVHMVANGLVFCLDADKKELSAYEGLSHESSVFPSIPRGSWPISSDICSGKWISVQILAVGDAISVAINDENIAKVEGVNILPLLGGSANNSGSVAFGGPEGWIAVYRNLLVKDSKGNELYNNSMCTGDATRTLEDFAVGSNSLACTMDGAKRDRATFGGDLHIMGRSIAYSTGFFEAVRGSIELLTSHQTEEGYLGNLCPIQAPVHTGDEQPPTYAFYSLTYALLLVVAVKDYWMHTGDDQIVRELWPKLQKLKKFAEGFINEQGLIAAPPSLSLTFFPLVGPVFGVSTQINLSFVDALRSMACMPSDKAEGIKLLDQANSLASKVKQHLYDEESGILRLGSLSSRTGLAQDVNAYGISLGVIPEHSRDVINLQQTEQPLPAAFKDLDRFDDLKLCSPYSASFAVEACFIRKQGTAALDLIRRIWGVMADETNPNFSGCHWEAMTLDGDPYHDTTSLVHGWSTSPVYLLPMYLAGLRPVKAGWKTWEARPVYCDIEEVKACVPTPFGNVEIEWHFDDRQGSVSCTAPDHIQGIIHPPAGWLIEHTGVFSSEGAVVSGRTERKLRKA